jgi:hypothetical protein
VGQVTRGVRFAVARKMPTIVMDKVRVMQDDNVHMTNSLLIGDTTKRPQGNLGEGDVAFRSRCQSVEQIAAWRSLRI